MNPSSNLFLIGPMGAGKSSIGRALATHYGMAFVDLDHEIEARTGAAIPLIFELEQEAGFRRREAALLEEFSARSGVVLATGGGAVLAETNRCLLAARGFVVYLEARLEDQLERLARDRLRPLLAHADRRERLDALNRARDPLYRAVADLVVPGRRETVPLACARAVALLDAHWQRLAPTEAA
ncbi:shikimate kinase [Mizugakiibacter sediminis]|uniref:Shikimate kinase n=1 Tax=Mizugakiibacter sediminis TaxID=1475481 RepID=A0A0K8QK03_9GAMM|nr:shikimate kinase [Mizugakiibacter sediminis]GAP65139.1 shikimate kinase [Mizugakiibacter sediminis]